MRRGLVRRIAVLAAAWNEVQLARLAAMHVAELEATVGPAAGAWLDHYLETVAEAELDGLPLEASRHIHPRSGASSRPGIVGRRRHDEAAAPSNPAHGSRTHGHGGPAPALCRALARRGVAGGHTAA
jgi:hypothetical protein